MSIEVIVFDVSHGSAAYVRTPTGEHMLLDCGRKADFSPAKFIGDHRTGDAPLDHLVVSHADDDHLADMGNVQSILRPRRIELAPTDWVRLDRERGSSRNRTQWQSIHDRASLSRVATPTYEMRFQTYRLSPYLADLIPGSRINNASVITTFEYMQWKFLFPGDLEVAGWNTLLRFDDFKAFIAGTNVLVAAHHGHESGYSVAALGHMDLRLVIASARNNDDSVEAQRYSRAASGLITSVRGVRGNRSLLTTRNDGSIQLFIDDAGALYVMTADIPADDGVPLLTLS